MAHDKKHDINSVEHHTGVSGTPGNLIALDANGLPSDSSSKPSDFAGSGHSHNLQDLPFTGDVIPDLDDQRSVGSPTNRVKKVWVGSGTVHIGNGEISYDEVNGELQLKATSGSEPMIIKTDGSPTPVTRLLVVDGNRTDDYTEKGSYEKPFKTIQAAINHAQTNVTPTPAWDAPLAILVYPGLYTENLVIRHQGIHLIGTGGQFVTRVKPASGAALIITNATESSLLDFIAAGGQSDPMTGYSNLIQDVTLDSITNIQIRDITFEGAGGNTNYRVMLLGVGAGISFMGQEFNAMRTTIMGSMFARCCNYVTIQDSSWLAGGLRCHNCAGAWLYKIEIGGNVMPTGSINWSYNVADEQPSDTGNYGPNMEHTIVRQDVTLGGSANMGVAGEFDSTICGNLVVNDTASFIKNGGAIHGNITLAATAGASTIGGCYVGGSITDPGAKLTGNKLATTSIP